MTISKRILVVAESIDVSDSSGTKGRVALIKNLHELGYQLRVCHYTKKEIQLEGIECIQIKELKWSLNYILSRSERIFTRLTKISLNKFLESNIGFSFTFLNDSNSIAKGVREQLDFNPDLVLTLSKGASFRTHHGLLKVPEVHQKWAAYVHDPFPYHFYPRPYTWVQPGYKQKERFFREVSQKAGVSVFPSLLLKEWMGSFFEGFEKTGQTIPHQISETITIKGEQNFPDYFEAQKFTLLHAGNLMKQRNPMPLIEAYKLFLERMPQAVNQSQLLLLGPSSFFSEKLNALKPELPSLVVKNENVPFYEVLKMQFQCSVNVILESKSEISPFLPGKFPHCIAANKPILFLSPYYSETKRILGDDYPYWSESDNVELISKQIEQLYEEWIANNGVVNLNRNDIESYLGKEYLRDKMQEILNDLT
ncbi:UDP-glycosyltransferase [Flavobacterium sp.]|uniref:UDP-glycosyltransferase n=1 Tax=Flavobacterium sp. TaxID=239 RepID=UPI0028BEF298|nr:UDP-glycosyltransferase [Flavobacterium sp.]